MSGVPTSQAQTRAAPRGTRVTRLAQTALVLVLVSAVLARPPGVIDAVSGDAVADVTLAPLAPLWRSVLAPLWIPLQLIGGLPLTRLLAWLGWGLALAVLLGRSGARHGVPRPPIPRGLLATPLHLTGWCLPLALLPVVLGWLDVLPSDGRGLQILATAGLGWLVGALHFRRRGRTGWTAVWRGRLGLSVLIVGLLLVQLHRVPGLRAAALVPRPPQGQLLVDVHAHGDTTHDAVLDVRERLEWFAASGVSVSAVSEHNAHDPDAFGELLAWTRADGPPLLPLPAEEYTTRACHLLLLGVRENVPRGRYRLPGADKSTAPDYGYDYARLIDDVHAAGGTVIVAHWWSARQWHRIPWERLVELGVDGFEVTNGPERAPPELIDAWRERGLLLLAGTDAHGRRPALHSWNLVPRQALLPDGGALTDLDPHVAVQRLLAAAPRPLVVDSVPHDVPAWLDPPASLALALRGLSTGERVSLVVWLLLLLAWCRRR